MPIIGFRYNDVGQYSTIRQPPFKTLNFYQTILFGLNIFGLLAFFKCNSFYIGQQEAFKIYDP